MNASVVKGGGVLHIVRRQQLFWDVGMGGTRARSAIAWRAEASHVPFHPRFA
jgi:hypothetical protein